MLITDYEKLGLFYLGRRVDPSTRVISEEPVLYEAADLVTHAVILGMTGSGKTGLGIGLIEEAAIDGIPVIAVDPKGDLSNLLLTFPELSPAEFAPWVSTDEARLHGVPPAEYAEREAKRWREGLAGSSQDAARVARLRSAVEMAVYTPGSRAARPLSVLRTFAAPAPSIGADPELLGERAAATATSLLAMAGLDTDDLNDRDHILVATLLGNAWRERRDLDLPALIAQVQSPPLQRVGVLDLEAFYPSAERFKLATRLNRLLAAPDFAVWLEGDPLDIDALLYTPTGKPRLTILSIAHLDDRERMFFVSLLLNELVAWMRMQRGTSSLRALLYIDEMMGYLPPVAVPPSKPPLLTLLKQARAFGLGLTLATQNPIDLDYKALANAGTWFLGRLQTERDKARLLDGLEGSNAASGSSLDRAETDRILSSLEKRTFLLHNVHEPAPLLFHTRWTLSYLRGPLGREEIARLASSHPPAPVVPFAPVAPVAPVAPAAPNTRPTVRDPSVVQYFAPGDGARWSPYLLGAARVAYADAKLGLDEARDVVVITPIGAGPLAVDWEQAEPADFAVSDLRSEAPTGGAFDPLPSAAATPRAYVKWSKDFAQWVAQSQSVELLKSAAAKAVSKPDESERDFSIRLQTTMREQRDAEMAKVRDRYASKMATLDDRVRRADAGIEKQKEQAAESRLQTGVSMAATVFGAILGRKAMSASTLGRATTAARGMSRMGREGQDVTRAQEEAAAQRQRRDELTAALQSELESVAERWDARQAPFERVVVKPKRGGVTVQLVALVWISDQFLAADH